MNCCNSSTKETDDVDTKEMLRLISSGRPTSHLAGHDGLDEEAEVGEHGQPPVLDLLHLRKHILYQTQLLYQGL